MRASNTEFTAITAYSAQAQDQEFVTPKHTVIRVTSGAVPTIGMQLRETMKVTIKDLSADIELKNNGMEIDVYDNAGKHMGDLVITKTSLIWCNGKTKRPNGVKISWPDFIADAMAKAAAAKAPKKAVGKKSAAPAAAPAAPAVNALKTPKAPKAQKAAKP